MSILIPVISAFIKSIAVYNVAKLPWYLGLLPTPEHGLESSVVMFALVGLRGHKMSAPPLLFFAPHTAAGSYLIWDYASFLEGSISSSLVWFAVATLFALHICT